MTKKRTKWTSTGGWPYESIHDELVEPDDDTCQECEGTGVFGDEEPCEYCGGTGEKT